MVAKNSKSFTYMRESDRYITRSILAPLPIETMRDFDFEACTVGQD
jgi:hypothetical protein